MVSLSPELQRQLDSFVQNGRFGSHEEVIARALKLLKTEDDEVAAIMEGWQDILNGDHVSLEEVDREMRKKYGIGS